MEEIRVLVNQKNGVLDFNFEQIKQQLNTEMDFYTNLVFTEEQKADAKKDVANLRKLKTAIDTKRKEVKKSFMEPYDDFEKKVKELISLIDQPIVLIDKQVKEFEEKQRKEKREKIETLFSETIGDIDFVTLDSIYKKEWENTSVSIKSIKSDMDETLFNIKQDIKTLNSFESDACEKAVKQYISNGYNLAPCIQYIQQYEQQKREIEEREKARREQETIERIRKEQEEKIREEMRLAEMEKEPATEKEEQGGFKFDEEPQGFNIPENKTTCFKVIGTESQLEMIRNYMKSISVEYMEE